VKNTLLKTILLFTLGSMGFLLIPSFFGPGLESGIFRFEHDMFKHEFFTQVLLLLFFYLNYFYLLPQIYGTGKKITYALIALACFLLIVSLAHLFTPIQFRLPPEFLSNTSIHPKPMPFRAMHMGATGFLFAMSVLFSLNIRINRQYKKALQEKTETELAYLKAQINPHFLFNTLNSLYALSLEKSDQTPDAILQLSQMMRYVLVDAEKEKVPLEKEIGFLKNYFALQQLRFGKHIKLHFEQQGETQQLFIAPLLLIPFVENAFKHGVNTNETTEISVRTSIRESIVLLEVFNNKTNPKIDT